jgi:predicted acyl esterase
LILAAVDVMLYYAMPPLTAAASNGAQRRVRLFMSPPASFTSFVTGLITCVAWNCVQVLLKWLAGCSPLATAALLQQGVVERLQLRALS